MCEVLDYRENKGRSEGWLKGKTEGMTEGWLKGKTEGRLEGRDEALFSVGMKMYLLGKENREIEEISGIPAEEIVRAAAQKGYKRGQNLGAAGAGN